MSITTIFILILAGAAVVAAVVAYAFAQSAKQAKHDRDEVKKLADSYVKQLVVLQAQIARRDKIIESIQGANHEAEQQRDKIDQAGPDPADRFDAVNSVLSDIAKSGSGSGSNAAAGTP